MIDTICFDADDTLWENADYFLQAEACYYEVCAEFGIGLDLRDALRKAEERNIPTHGYGAKTHSLSMIDAALAISNGAVTGVQLERLRDATRDLMDHPVEPLDGVVDALDTLAGTARMIVLTKGDLLDQSRKIERSGLADYFDVVRVVREKDVATYSQTFRELHIDPTRAVMIGNSMKSDVLPMIEAGGWGVHLPHLVEWHFEKAEAPANTDRFVEISTMAEFPEVITRIRSS